MTLSEQADELRHAVYSAPIPDETVRDLLASMADLLCSMAHGISEANQSAERAVRAAHPSLLPDD